MLFTYFRTKKLLLTEAGKSELKKRK